METIKVIQINLGKGKEATALLEHKMNDEDISIALIQEPYFRSKSSANFILYLEKKVAVLIDKRKFTSMMISEHTNQNTVTVRITNTNPPLVVSSIYSEPKARLKAHLNRIEGISKDINRNLIIAGDFNAKNVVWGGETTDRRGERLLDTIVRSGMNIENSGNSEPTFHSTNGRSWIDLTLTKNTSITEWMVETAESLSDHKYISFSTSLAVQNPKLRSTYNVKQADWELFRSHITKHNYTITAGNKTPNEQAEQLQNVATEACNNAMPKRKGTSRKIYNTWWTEELQRMKTKLRRTRRKMQNATTAEEKSDLQEKLREYRKKYKNNINSAKHLSLVKALEENNNNKDPWDIAHKIINTKGRPPIKNKSIQRTDGSWTKTEKETTEEYINKYFPKDTKNDDTHQNRIDRECVCSWSEQGTPAITKEELINVVNSRPRRKTPGPDKFPNQALKPLGELLASEWVTVLNNCIRHGLFPRTWKTAEISWIPKPGSDDLRPICLLPTIGKVFDKILADRLTHFLETKNKLNRHQYGFRKTRSTIAAIGNVEEVFRQNVKKKWHTLSVTMDIKNAFNSAWYPRLEHLLAETGCPSDLGKTIINFLQDRKIMTNGVEQDTERGAPQGSCLGAILWLVIMEDWFDQMAKIATDEKTSLHVQAYADDQFIMISGTSVKRIEELWTRTWQNCKKWAEDNKLKYAPQKTIAMFSPAKNKLRPPVIRMDDTKITPSKTLKYLGIILDEKFTWIEHAKYVRGKVLEKAHRLFIVAGKTWGTDKKILRNIYEGAIKPLMLYGAEIWGQNVGSKLIQKHLEAAQRPFLLAISKGYRTTANKTLQIIANQPPLYLEAKKRRELYMEIRSGEYCRKPPPQEKLHPAAHKHRDYDIVKRSPANVGSNDIWIFTDASISANTGLAVIICEKFMTTKKLWTVTGRRKTHSAELKALELAADIIIGQDKRKKTINFVTDSRVALGKLCNPPHTDACTNNAARKIQLLETHGNKVKLHWTSGHKNHTKEMMAVDKLARKAAISTEPYQPTSICLEESEAKRKIEERATAKWIKEWTTTQAGRNVFKIIALPTENATKLSPKAVHLITQHGPFNMYLNRFNLKDVTPTCICGTNNDDMLHILNECPDPRRKSAREEFSEKSTDGKIHLQITDLSTTEYIRKVNELAENMVFDYYR